MAYLSAPDTPHIAIIGGGFAGIVTLAQLVRGAESALRITLIEKSSNLARGAAYSTPYPYHLLNVRTDRMGAFADTPHGFHDWLQTPNGKAATEARCPHVAVKPDNYLPRLLYGAYLDGILQNAKSEASRKGLEIAVLHGEAMRVTRSPEGLSITIREKTLQASHMVLATGNAPPRRFSFLSSVVNHMSLIEDIWAIPPLGLHKDRMTRLGKNSHVCIIGTGLTAVDAVLTLHYHGYEGRITLLSRHGLLPAPHREGFAPQKPSMASRMPQTALELLASLRQEAKAFPGDWRALVDALRPHTTTLWRGLPEQEKKRFLSRLFSFWNVHRHRMAPEIHQVLEQLEAKNALRIEAGSIRDVNPISSTQVQITYRPQHGLPEASMVCDLVLNCAGPDYDVISPANPLLASMCEQGLLAPSPLRWGVKLAADGSAKGEAEGKIFPMGTLRIEEELECTAVPELRVQAENIAEAVLRRLV